MIDIRFRVIKNVVLLMLFIVQLCLCLIGNESYFISASIVFAFGFFLYPLGWLGAGDIKYASLLSLSLPIGLLPIAFILTMMTGGLLSIFYLIFNSVRRRNTNKHGDIKEDSYSSGIPYGVAISVGFYVVILSHWVNYL